MQQPFEEEFSDQADEMADLMSEGEEGLEEGYEVEGFEGEDVEGEGYEAEGFEGEDVEGEGYEAEGFEGEDVEGEGFETEEAHAIEDVFAEAMDAEDEDEFSGRLSESAGVGEPGPAASRPMLLAQRVQQAAAQQGSAGPNRADAMDAFADVAADYASDEDLDVFTPVLGGLAARHVVRSTIPPARRRQQPQQVRALGRAVGRATSQIAQRLVQRYGARALPAVTRVVREVTRLVRQQGASPQAVPRMIRRIGSRVAASPRAVRRLARPIPGTRQLRARAGIRRPASRPQRGARGARVGMGTRRIRTVTLRGPVRIVVR